MIVSGSDGLEFPDGSDQGTAFTGNASTITTGTIATARLPSSGVNAASITVGTLPAAQLPSSGVNASSITVGTLPAAQLPSSGVNAASITVGTIATARLGSGTANATTFLRGDQTYAVVSSGTLIPTGTVMIFGQTSAPTGFTKLVDQDNAALRLVSGSASTGGSVNFTTAFASQAVSGTVGTSGSFTLANANIPSHTHGITIASNFGGGFTIAAGQGDNGNPLFTTGTGGGGSHSHSGGSFTGTAINLAVKYVDVIRATKD
jgi:hypothetical protein